jgi:DNA (cytosine-5)-methyltransferase 1
METERFRAWLERSTGLGALSSKDVVSRLRRASKFVSLASKADTEDVLHRLGKHPDFKRLSTSVRSQLRRAVRLFRDFESRS